MKIEIAEINPRVLEEGTVWDRAGHEDRVVLMQTGMGILKAFCVGPNGDVAFNRSTDAEYTRKDEVPAGWTFVGNG